MQDTFPGGADESPVQSNHQPLQHSTRVQKPRLDPDPMLRRQLLSAAPYGHANSRSCAEAAAAAGAAVEDEVNLVA